MISTICSRAIIVAAVVSFSACSKPPAVKDGVATDDGIAEIALPEEDDPSEDVFSSWDTWDTLRTMCNYDSRLSVGKQHFISFFLSSIVLFFSCLFFIIPPFTTIARFFFHQHAVRT